MSETKLPAPREQTTLFVWLLVALKPMSRSKVKNLLRYGRVLVNCVPTTRHDHRLSPGDRVSISRERSAPRPQGFERSGIAIVVEDDALIVIDKPPGLLTVATDADKTD